MKLNKILYGILAIGALSTSCTDKMEYHEYINYDEDYVKLNFANIGGLVANTYLYLDTDFGNYSGALLASASDESEYAYSSNQIADFYNGSWSPTNAKSSIWTSSYEGIAYCNLFLDKYTGLTFPELQLNEDYKAQLYRYNNYQYEMRFLRAYFYFNLVRQYGDVAFSDHMMTAEESNALTRRPAQEVFDFIIDECDAIKNEIIEDYSNLEVPLPSEPSETGRANKRAVLALKARTALYAASPLFNTTNDKELWKRAATANKELLDECKAYNMTLVSDYSTLWSVDNYKDTKELIFGRRANRENSTMESYNFPAGLTGSSGGNCPTQTLVDAYEMKETGLRWNEAGSGYQADAPYEGRDPRFEKTIARNGETGWPKWNTEALETFQNGSNGEPLTGGTPTGYYLKKYCQSDIDLRDNSTKKVAYHTWITFRLGEFYLNYAEAMFKYMELSGQSKAAYVLADDFTMTANEAVNKTRQRAGILDFPSDMSNDDWWEKYKNERMVELAFEGHRFWDVRRWKEAGKYFTSIDEMKITKNGNDFSYTRKTVSRQWDDKMYFFPIPRTEIMKNPNLEQNPGW